MTMVGAAPGSWLTDRISVGSLAVQPSRCEAPSVHARTLMVSDVITRYFQLDADRDVDGVTDLFTEEAVALLIAP